MASGMASGVMPCATTIRSWILRLGLYARTRPHDPNVRRVWFVDHTIPIGVVKLLVILSCPLSEVPFGERALAVKDLSLIAMVPMERSTGDLVERELEKAALRVGPPALIVSDQGADLQKGIRAYGECRPQVAQVPDIAHYGANLLQREWEGHPRWTEFLAKLQDVSSKLRQSKSAELMAPRLRAKARFMNIGIQVRFAQRVLKLLESPTASAKVVEHYSWLKDYRAELSVWLGEHGWVSSTIATLRVEGLHAGSLREVRGYTALFHAALLGIHAFEAGAELDGGDTFASLLSINLTLDMYTCASLDSYVRS